MPISSAIFDLLETFLTSVVVVIVVSVVTVESDGTRTVEGVVLCVPFGITLKLYEIEHQV